ncbi:hypothetical protein GJU43_00575 [Flavobacterium sp. LC2016-23]|uniref:hypothetical protein n=1 Tax=Flavobacterium sp. LC2016-23 TaxID=2666330 RepID=UPI0012B05726|nr:hypothetical protein [Flavobacterium sp. LC2016-23]MRX37756.1 hypothetical protein [Flavobacterium sp. LC2016-23]
MKAIIVLLMITISGTIYSQDYATLKKSDTVYVFFKQNQYKQIYMPQSKGYGDYIFVFNEYYKHTQIMLYHNPYIAEEKKEKKSFLKKHKSIMINYDFLINMLSYQDAKKLLLSKKKIYVIDDNDTGWFSIKLKEVKVNDYNNNPIE